MHSTVEPDPTSDEPTSFVPCLATELETERIAVMAIGAERVEFRVMREGAYCSIVGVAVVIATDKGPRVSAFAMVPDMARKLAHSLLALSDGEPT